MHQSKISQLSRSQWSVNGVSTQVSIKCQLSIDQVSMEGINATQLDCRCPYWHMIQLIKDSKNFNHASTTDVCCCVVLLISLCTLFRPMVQDRYNSLHLVQKGALMFVCGDYLVWEATSVQRAKLEDTMWASRNRWSPNTNSCSSIIICEINWWLLCLFSFTCFSWHAEFWKLRRRSLEYSQVLAGAYSILWHI